MKSSLIWKLVLFLVLFLLIWVSDDGPSSNSSLSPVIDGSVFCCCSKRTPKIVNETRGFLVTPAVSAIYKQGGLPSMIL